MFLSLTNKEVVDTGYDVVNIIISSCSSQAVAIVKKNDEYFEVHQYSLSTYQLLYKHSYEGKYVRMNLIEESCDGKSFAIAYQDNGTFFVQVIAKSGEVVDTLNVTEHLVLNTESQPILGFFEPLITSVFVPS